MKNTYIDLGCWNGRSVHESGNDATDVEGYFVSDEARRAHQNETG